MALIQTLYFAYALSLAVRDLNNPPPTASA
jgi:hypothetical protein